MALQLATLGAPSLARLLATAVLRRLGGEGSGNFGHAGRPGEVGGSGEGGSAEWFGSLEKVGSAKGSNPGGTYKDANGQKWYVKHYKDPRQGFSEQVANDVYRAVGLNVPTSLAGPEGQFATRWVEGTKTVGSVGLTKESADKILDGYAADVFLANWDAVGTGLDNAVLTKSGEIMRIDQGGTLLFRAQGGLKPEGGLDGVGEWKSLADPNRNVYYARVFKTAGVKDPEALGARAIKQIERISAARPKGGWETFVRHSTPHAPSAYVKRVGAMLESRQKGLEAIAASLKLKGAEEFRALWPDAEGQDDHGRGDSGGSDVAVKAVALSAERFDSRGKPDANGEFAPNPLPKLQGKDIREATHSALDPIIQAYGQTEVIDPTIVMSGQKTVSIAVVKEYVDNPSKTADVAKGRSGNELIVVKRDGKMAVIDGNHRLAAAAVAGRSIRATVVDMDKAFAEGKAAQREGEGYLLGLMKAANARLKLRGAEFNEDQARDETGKWTSGGGGQKAPKSPNATKDQIAGAYAMYKAGAKHKETADKLGLTEKQVATLIFKVNKQEKEIAAALAAGQQPSVNPATGLAYDKATGLFSNKETGEGVSVIANTKTAKEDVVVKDGGYYTAKGEFLGAVPGSKASSEAEGMIFGKNGELVPSQSSAGVASVTGKLDPTAGEKMPGGGQLPAGYTFGPKAGSASGLYAIHKDGVQVSKGVTKGEWVAAVNSMHQGKGPDTAWVAPPASSVASTPSYPSHDSAVWDKQITGEKAATGDWPVHDNDVRAYSTAQATQLTQANEAWRTSLTGVEISAIHNYTGSGYGGLNAALRGEQSLSPSQKVMADRLTKALDKAPSVPPPDVVWRGTGSAGAKAFVDKLGHGDVIHLNGFQSSSIDPGFAHSWGGGTKGVLFEIHPAKGAWVMPISSHKQEKEFLMPHGARYVVHGARDVKMHTQSGTHTVKVIQLQMLTGGKS